MRDCDDDGIWEAEQKNERMLTNGPWQPNPDDALEYWLASLEELENEMTDRQTRNLVEDYLHNRKFVTWDGIKVAQAIRSHWGIKVDWHVCSQILDEMTGREQAEITGGRRDGMMEYRIK